MDRGERIVEAHSGYLFASLVAYLCVHVRERFVDLLHVRLDLLETEFLLSIFHQLVEIALHQLEHESQPTTRRIEQHFVQLDDFGVWAKFFDGLSDRKVSGEASEGNHQWSIALPESLSASRPRQWMCTNSSCT